MAGQTAPFRSVEEWMAMRRQARGVREVTTPSHLAHLHANRTHTEPYLLRLWPMT